MPLSENTALPRGYQDAVAYVDELIVLGKDAAERLMPPGIKGHDRAVLKTQLAMQYTDAVIAVALERMGGLTVVKR